MKSQRAFTASIKGNEADITFDDILKMGAKEGADLLRSIIGRELNHHDYRVRALTSIRVPVYKEGRIEDLLKLLQYEKEGRK